MDEPLRAFLDALDYDGEPFGMVHTDQEPPSGFAPMPGPAQRVAVAAAPAIRARLRPGAPD